MRGRNVMTYRTFFTMAFALMIFLFLDTGPLRGQHSGVILLAGYKESPPVATQASGTVVFSVKADTLVIRGDFSKLTGVYRTSAIYYGKKEETGNRIFRLKADLNEEKNGGTFKAKENTFVLSDDVKELLMNGELYINIHSSEYTRGEIRGQIPGKS